ARRLNLLARIYKHQGDLDNALVFAEKALQKTDSTVRLAGEKANALRMVGRLKAIKGDFDNGEKILQEALLIDRSLENPTKIAADLEALAETSQLRGDLERSKDYLLRAARVKEQIHPLICGSASDDSN
ncbi:MAG: tetratricopeptide repeat protein, partial [Trichlorobacter sp.]|nr:tetratricopeptide repeat protein [Trichlorobacter sp.]